MKRTLSLLTLALLVVSVWMVTTRALATPVAGGTVSYATQDISGFVTETTSPNPFNRYFYFGYQGQTDSSPAIFFQGYYDVEYVNGEPSRFHGFDETSGQPFIATASKTSEDPQYRVYSVNIEFPQRNASLDQSVTYRTYAGQTPMIPVWPRAITGAGMTPVSTSAEPFSTRYQAVFTRWVSDGAIANNFRKHLLGIGILPASGDDIDFLRSELKASQDQLAGAGGQP